jgi:RHS repeat-associated protein
MRTDPVTGLVDMGARHYDPGRGRFTTPDTVIGALPAPVSLNRYLYANADPVNYTDPDGHWPQWLKDTIDKVSDAVSDFVDSWSDEFSTGLRSDYRSDAPATRFVTSAIDTASETVADTFRTAGVAASCAKQDESACRSIEQMFTWDGAVGAWHATTDPLVRAWHTRQAEDWGTAAVTVAGALLGGRGLTNRLRPATTPPGTLQRPTRPPHHTIPRRAGRRATGNRLPDHQPRPEHTLPEQ